MREYVIQQTAILLRRLAYEVNRASKNADDDAVHDLRVAIRRLSRCLKLFSPFYPGRSWKKVRQRLSDVMDAAGEVRDLDIAAKLLEQAGVPAAAPAFRRLGSDRRTAARRLSVELRDWRQRSFSKKWRTQLGL